MGLTMQNYYLPRVIFTHADDSRESKTFSDCEFVYLHDNSKTNNPKVFKFGIRDDLWIAYKWYDLESKGQRSRSKGQKVQKTY